MICVLRYAEASCTSQISTARAVVAEFGETQTHVSGIKQWADIQNQNSERDTHRVVKKQGTSLNVPITEVRIQGTLLPWIRPRDWLQYIVSHGLLYMLSGLHRGARHSVGNNFGQSTKPYIQILVCSTWTVTTMRIQLDCIFTGMRATHSNVLASWWQAYKVCSVWGFLTNVLKDQKRQHAYRWTSLGTHLQVGLIVSVLPKSHYQNNPEYFHDTMGELSKDLRGLLDDGVFDPVSNKLYKFVLLGVKGDMPYLQKMGRFKRSWNTAVKRGNERQAPKGVCHLCLAGTRLFPCEDTSSDPCWGPTCGTVVPWDTTPCVIQRLPHDRHDPGSFFLADLWHCVHLGIGKSFVASTLQVALEVVPKANNEERFEWLSTHYKTWRRSMRKPCHVSKISAYLVSYHDTAGATGNWSKGSLTTNLCLWVVDLLAALPQDSRGFLPRCKEMGRQFNEAISFLYNAPLFLEGEECTFVVSRGMYFVQEYTRLAQDSYNANKAQWFPLFPKLHAVHHCFRTIQIDYDTHAMATNPLCASCQCDEDAIGRVSRVSRRVNIRSVILRTLQRYRIACWKVWQDADIITWTRVQNCGKALGWNVCVWPGGNARFWLSLIAFCFLICNFKRHKTGRYSRSQKSKNPGLWETGFLRWKPGKNQ